MRIILATIFTGQAVSFIYSVSGGFLCLIVMAAVNKLLRGQYIFLTGILGAVSHNAGQILAAFFILRLSGIFAYMPFLVISGVITGLFTGLVCFFADRYIPKKIYYVADGGDCEKKSCCSGGCDCPACRGKCGFYYIYEIRKE